MKLTPLFFSFFSFSFLLGEPADGRARMDLSDLRSGRGAASMEAMAGHAAGPMASAESLREDSEELRRSAAKSEAASSSSSALRDRSSDLRTVLAHSAEHNSARAGGESAASRRERRDKGEAFEARRRESARWW